MFSLVNFIIIALVGAVISGLAHDYNRMIGMLVSAIVLSAIWLVRFGFRKYKASKQTTESTSQYST